MMKSVRKKFIVSREKAEGYLAPEHCIHSDYIAYFYGTNYQDHRPSVSLSLSPGSL